MNLKLSIVNYQLTILLLLFFALPVKAQVTIGAQKAPHSYSQLELAGTKGGVRLPMLNTSERDALKLTSDSTEANGLVIYNTDISCVEFWSDGKWIDVVPAFNINPATLATLSTGSGFLSGRVFFDIDATEGGTACGNQADREANKADFTQTAINTQTYTFTASGTVRNVRYVIQDSESVLKASQSLTGTLVLGTLANSTSIQLTLNFKPDLNLQSSNPLIIGRDRSTAAKVIINIIYNNGSTDVKVPLTLSIQDCSCGNSVKTTSGGWLTFMCYNLGADDTLQFMSPVQQANYVTAINEYGDLYQWGRQADGHQLRTSASVAGPITTLDDNGQPTGVNAGKFITTDSSPNDWRNPQCDTLWYNKGKKTVNDPCPEGWRVPTTNELQSILDGGSEQISLPLSGYVSNSGNTWRPVPRGMLITPSGSSEPALFLSSGGARNNGGSIINAGFSGYYWSSSVNSTIPYFLAFDGSNIYSGNLIYGRSYGMGIRCVAE